YGHGLADRPQLVALNKIDLAEARAAVPALESALSAREIASVTVSAAAREGVGDLLREIFDRCPPREVTASPSAPRERRIAFAGGAQDWRVRREGGAFRVTGDRVERLASGIDWESPDAAAYFQHQLVRIGLDRDGPSYTVDTLQALRDQGELFLLIGGDAYAELAKWKDPERIGSLATIVVAARPGAPNAPHGVHLLDAPMLDISSRELRARAARGKSLRYLVMEAAL